ncbi:MAG: transposase [bacterium]|nr:transposase [bacterium]
MARSRYKIYEDQQPHFLTCTIVNWLPIFSSRAVAQIILDSLQFLQEHERLTLYAYVLLENHLHLIASSHALSQEIANFKSFTAKKIIHFFTERHAQHILKLLREMKASHKHDRIYQLWQEGSHPELIQGEAMMRQKIEYIHNNPVKRGYVDEPAHWRYSSARDYAGKEGLVKVTRAW